MDEDRDPFLEDVDLKGKDSQGAQSSGMDDENRTTQTSPILNSTGSSGNASLAGRRKGRIRRSGSNFPTTLSMPVDSTLYSLKACRSPPAQSLSLSQEFQPDFIAPKTPVHFCLPAEKDSPQQPPSDDVQSDDDIFASPACDDSVNPSGLNALFDRPETADLSWCMITPSANQASNTSWSNLNTEERKVLLPSDDSTLVVKPRALFSPDANDTADSHSLNMSLDAEGLLALKAQKTDKTPIYRRRKNSLVSAVAIESPLATFIGAEDSFYETPNLKSCKRRPLATTGSPILSGSKEFSKSPINDKGEEDLFDNEEDCLVDILPHSQCQTSQVPDPKIAESTPHTGYRKKAPLDEMKQTVTPQKNCELFPQDISLSVLEGVCQAQELRDQAPVCTPEKQSETKTKRLLFSSNLGTPNDKKSKFQAPEGNLKGNEESCKQENDDSHSIPDDSFMEHLAAMNTSIFSDNLQPVTKVQSIKTSLSKMKKFCYSADKKVDQNAVKTLNTCEPKTLMKEILSSVIELETPPAPLVTTKPKQIKSSGELVVFSQMQEEIFKDLQEDPMEVAHNRNECTFKQPALRENRLSSTNANASKSLISPCQGFLTGSGKPVDLSEEALSKGLNLLKDCMEAVEPSTPSTSLSVPVAAEPKRMERNPSDDLAAEEIKQLLQLVNDGEDFNPWNGSEELPSPKTAKQENLISPRSSTKCGDFLRAEIKSEAVDLDSLSGGFSTAGGKNIHVSEGNLARAAKLLLEPEENSTNSDENMIFNKNLVDDKSNAHHNEIAGKCNSANSVSVSVNRKRPMGKAPNTSGLTIPTKKACLSIADPLPSSEEKSNNLISRGDIQKDGASSSKIDTEAIPKALVNISEEAMNVVNNLIFNSSHKRKDPPPTGRAVVGFSTASGRTVNVSKEALDKGKNLFDDLSADSEANSCVNVSMETPKSHHDNKNIKIEVISKDDATVPEKCMKLAGSFSDYAAQTSSAAVGFSTAGGRTVNVSEKALKQEKKLFDDFSEPDSNLELNPCIPEVRRSLGSVSKPELQSTSKAQTPVPNSTNLKIEDRVLAPKSVPSRKVRRSLGSACRQGMQSPKKAPTADLGVMHSKTGGVSFPRSNGQSGSVSKEEVRIFRNSFDDFQSELMRKTSESHVKSNSTITPTVDMAGFSTAGGKAVQISKAALNKARNLFEDLPSESSDSAIKSNPAKKPSVDMAGFSTAGGKAVQISEVALDKARNLLEDQPTGSSDSALKSNPTKKPSVDMSGFSTAGGKAVQISKEALNRARNLFDDMPTGSSDSALKSNPAKKPSVDMSGFLTAGGKAVQISEEALNKGRNLFDDLPDKPSLPVVKSSSVGKPSVDMAGFSTAGGKAVQISEEALNKARNLFDDKPSHSESKSSSAESPSVDMSGFSTAGGKAVQISEAALNRARNLFDDQPAMSSGTDAKSSSAKKPIVDMSGFSTAGGNAVQISEEALNRARNLFDDLPSESSDSDEKSHSTSKPHVSSSADAKSSVPSKPSFDIAGFSTAGGRAVQISKEALNKARNLLDDASSTNLNGNAEDDSGVFSSCNDSHINPFRSRDHRSLIANKENTFLSKDSGLKNGGYQDDSSLAQEITESTAAILADDGFDVTGSIDEAGISRQTISTSPSMVTDRPGRLKPVLSSVSENKCNPNEPTSPILSRSSNAASRKRPRRGRLSLSNTGCRISPPSGIQSVSSSQDCHRRARLSLPATVSSSDLALSDAFDQNSASIVVERCRLESVADESSTTNDIQSSSKLPPSRKLFDSETDMSPAKLNSPASKINLDVPPEIECSALPTTTIDPKAFPVSRLPHQNPIMRKSLPNQSSGFKTPYKSSPKKQSKRSSSSPLQNPPEAKRMKPSTNLYVSHVHFSSLGSGKSNPRNLRPEVAEMRRRVAEEQKQVVDNYAEHKGELLRPCLGSWLSGKLSVKSCGKLLKMSALGSPANCSPGELLRSGVKSSSMSISAANAADFRFSAWEYYSEDLCRENVAGIPVGDGALLMLDTKGFIGVEEFQRAFLASPGVDPSLVPSGWIKNHYRWLVWKLAALECHFPSQLGGRCFSPHVLMLQLKYRYDREIDRCERPALRRIFEHDDSAAKRMVLCVASVLIRDEPTNGLELELTDGWYSVIASIDQDMQYRVKKDTIKIGTKLIMHNAELVNCSEGCHPLQVRDDVRLKLCSNSTRRARWSAKLGFQNNPGPINVPLSSILSSGGLVSCVTAYVARVYPLVFMEKTAEKTVVRSQRAESKQMAKHERSRDQIADKVYSQVQAELQKEQSQQKSSTKKFTLKHIATLMSGEELSDILETASDPLSIQSVLTEEQKQIVSNYQRTKQDELRSELEARVRVRLSDNVNHARQVTPILKVRLFDEFNGNQCGAILSVWRPSEDMTSIFKEGHKVAIFSAVANGVRCGDLQLSANRSTRYNCDNVGDLNPNLTRCLCPLESLSLQGFLPRFGEIDVVGIVIRISAAPQTSENPTHFQTAYLSDGDQNIVAIQFWGGLKEFGLEDLITLRSLIAAINLQCRGSPIVKAVPCVYASELSFFTTNPRQQYLQSAQQKLRRSLLPDLKTFCQLCEDKLDDLSQNMSPSACPKTPEENCVKSSVLNDNSPNVNIGSTKAQRKLSLEEQLKTPSPNCSRSPAVEKRLASLERYGDAVHISPIFISQPRRSLRQDFKVPRRTNSPSTGCKKD